MRVTATLSRARAGGTAHLCCSAASKIVRRTRPELGTQIRFADWTAEVVTVLGVEGNQVRVGINALKNVYRAPGRDHFVILPPE